MKEPIPALALRRPITVIMITLTVLGMGVIAKYKIPLELIPRMDLPMISAVIPYPGATPEQVEKEIAIPAEGEFKTIPNLTRISTTSDNNGCQVAMQFDWDADMAVATGEVRDRVERLKLELPTGADRVYLRRFTSNQLPVLVFSIARQEDEDELAHLVRTVLEPRLMRIDGVADIQVFSKPEKEVLIEFDQNKLQSRGLSLYEVVSNLQSASLNISMGSLTDETRRYFVRAVDEFTSPEQMADIIVGPNGERLREVADVGFKSREPDMEYSLDGTGGAIVLVRKESEANAIHVCEQVHAELARIKEEKVLGDISLFVFADQSDMILSALGSLLQAGKYGGAMALIVLFLFLRRFRMTIIVALAIPVSLVVALAYMYFSGMSLNLVTMISLIIAVGMLVDNSIVVVENIARYSERGYGAAESALRGASEVSLAITAATLTTVVVFIPIFYMDSGKMSVYMRSFAAPVTVSLLASLLVALTLIPLASSIMKTKKKRLPKPDALPANADATTDGIEPPRPAERPDSGWRFHPFKWLVSLYLAVLQRALRYRLPTCATVIALCVVTKFTACEGLQTQNMAPVDTREVHVQIEFDDNVDMAKASELMRAYEGFILGEDDSKKREYAIKNVFYTHTSDDGTLRLYLYKPEDNVPENVELTYTTEQVRDILWATLPKLPGSQPRLSVAEAGDMTARSISVRMRGDDTHLLNAHTESFIAKLEAIPELTDVVTDTARETQEMRLDIDEIAAEKAGVSPLIIARTVDFALRGSRMPYMKREGREIPVWAQFREEDRRTKENLDNLAIMSATGRQIPLTQLVQDEIVASPKAIHRVDGKNVVGITAKVNSENLSGTRDKIDKLIEGYELPRGYRIDKGDELMELVQNMGNFSTALLLAIVLIYIVMGALFESYVLPLSVLTTVPLAFIGAVWSMFLTSTPFDTVAFIGMVLMVGIIVNNGIVIIDHINQLRAKGMGRMEAIMQAGRDRFRPVMMTALTTILGCVPLSLGGGGIGGQVSFQGLGRALIGGLTTGTLLTLLIVPVAYTVFDDLRKWCGNYAANLIGFASGK